MSQATDILCANLDRLRAVDPELAQRIEQATPADLEWTASRAGPATATIQHGQHRLWLASRFDPDAEAAKLIADVDHARHAGIVVLGLGLGYHVTKLAAELRDNAVLVVFEPDLGLLHAVLASCDHTAWLGRPNVILADTHVDRTQLIRRLEKFAGIITQGTVLVTHPPTRTMHGPALANFGAMLTDALAYCRTHIATALVNSSRTIRNLMTNLPYYAAGAHVDELAGAAAGYPAICVGAGPSLARNVRLLTDPAVRRNVIVITAQTTLKPLLAHGIEPDFVTALDFHEISRRFYEDLPPLPTVTLIAEPLANGAILDSFPGPIRVTDHKYLDRVLGQRGAHLQPRKRIRHGATVAHLSFYLAQHLGCDPIIFIGQDLGFSDGLYYTPGTAIHDVWAPELGPFNTLEMMEWQRIVRHRQHLKKLQDAQGHPIYSDEQMLTYLKQFERDFAVAEQTIIDATEGGLPKLDTVRMPLADALAKHATRPAPRLPLPPAGLDPQRLELARSIVEQRIAEFEQLQQVQREALDVLGQMLEHQRDLKRMDKLFARMDELHREVGRLGEAFALLHELNAVGAFRRERADRAIEHADADALQKQRMRIERDLENIEWLTQTCDESLAIYRDALSRLRPGAGNSASVQGTR